mgnify:CR=1 FL=1
MNEEKPKALFYLLIVVGFVCFLSVQYSVASQSNQSTSSHQTTLSQKIVTAAQKQGWANHIQSIDHYGPGIRGWYRVRQSLQIKIRTDQIQAISAGLAGPIPKGCTVTITSQQNQTRHLNPVDQGNGLRMAHIDSKGATITAQPWQQCHQKLPRLIVIQSGMGQNAQR